MSFSQDDGNAHAILLRRQHEVALGQEGAIVARLVAGAPLLRVLELPLEQAERLRGVYTPAIATQPLVSAALEYRCERERRAS